LRISGKNRYNRSGNSLLTKRYRINQFIRAEQVRLIDEAGQNLGVMATAAAIALAQDKGLDLVEVFPLAQPPVAKIIDYSKLKYEETKQLRKIKAQQKKVEVKGIRLSLRISQHDIDVRINQSNGFLADGDKVRIEMILRGREKSRLDLARKIINDFITALNQTKPVKVEQALTIQGGKLSILVA